MAEQKVRQIYLARLEELVQGFASLVDGLSRDSALRELDGPTLQEFRQERIFEIVREFWDEERESTILALMDRNSLLERELHQREEASAFQKCSASEAQRHCDEIITKYKEQEQAFEEKHNRLKAEILNTARLSDDDRELQIARVRKEQEESIAELVEYQRALKLIKEEQQGLEHRLEMEIDHSRCLREELEIIREEKIQMELEFQRILKHKEGEMTTAEEMWEEELRELSSQAAGKSCQRCHSTAEELRVARESLRGTEKALALT